VNLLSLVQAASVEMGLPSPVSVVGNTTQTVVQLYGLINGLGRELAQTYDWQGLDKEYRFTTQYSTQTGYNTSGTAVITGLSDTSSISTAWQVTGTGIPQDCYVQSVDSATQVTLTQATTADNSAGFTVSFAQTKYALPSDYLKPVNRTQWDKSRHWEMLGPATPQQWQWLKSGFIATGPRIQYRLLGGTFQIWPMIVANEYLGFEYYANSWASSSSGTAQTTMSDDTDTCIYPDNLMISGLKLKYFMLHGFDSTMFMAEFRQALASALGADKGAQTLAMSGTPTNILINLSNVPDSGFGVSS
jgi:hypothetical protein